MSAFGYDREYTADEYSGDLRSHVSHELDVGQHDIEEIYRKLRRLEARINEFSSGNLLRASALQGVIPPINGGSGAIGNTLGAVSMWANNSGATQVQGTVVVENGDRTFGTTTTVDSPLVIGVLDDASIAVGVDGRIRHTGYQGVVKTQGAVVVGHYLRASATVGRAEDAGATPSTGSFGVALTASGGGAATVAAYVFPPIGTGSASTADNLVYIGTAADLTAGRALTAGSGIAVPVSGADPNKLVTVSLAALTALYDQTGAFNWVYDGGDLIVANSKNLKLYSDVGPTPATLKGQWDATLGHMGVGKASISTIVLDVLDVFVDITNATAAKASLTPRLSAGNSAGLQIGLDSLVTPGNLDAANPRTFTAAPGIIGMRSLINVVSLAGSTVNITEARNTDSQMAIASPSVVTTRVGFYIREATGSGTLTNQYGLFIENLTKGGTLNRAIHSVGGVSDHLGAFTIGANAAPDAMAILDLASTTLGLLIPRIATASRPAGLNGLIYYDSTTNKYVAYENGAYANMIADVSDTSTVSTVATTDATVTTLQTITLPASTTMQIRSRVVARRTGGAGGTAEDGAGYDITATIKNVAGVATLIGAVVVLSTQEDQAAFDATIDVTGATARVRVTGAATNNVDWKCATRTLSVT